MKLASGLLAFALLHAAALVQAQAPADYRTPAPTGSAEAAVPQAGAGGASTSGATGSGPLGGAGEAGRPAGTPLHAALALKLSPTAHGPNIYLGDLVEGLPLEASSAVVKSTGGLGNTVAVDTALLALKLRLAPGGPWSLALPRASIRVGVPAQTVAGKLIANFAQDYLAAQLSGTPGVDLEQQGSVFDLRLYDAPVRFRIHPPENVALRGPVVLRVEVLQAGQTGEEKVSETVPVNFMVHRKEQRLFTTQAVRMGEPFGPQNLEAHTVDATMLGDGYSDLGQVQGKVARTFVPPGRPLLPALVDLPPSIRQGDVVRILVRSGLVEVETSGKAMRDARIGDSLPLQILDTGKQVEARCVDTDVAVEQAW